MAGTKSTSSAVKKSSTNPIVVVGIGCFVILVVLGLIGSLIGRFLFKRAATSLIEGAIQSKTGVKTNLSDIEQGKMIFTDQKTGSTVDVGSGKVPDSFPKDFPVYPGAKVISSLAGGDKKNGNGFWLTLSTSDSVDKVSSYYKSQLSSNNWETTATYSTADTTTESVTKGNLSGSVAVSKANGGKETDIIIILGQDNSATAPAAQNDTTTPTQDTSSQ